MAIGRWKVLPLLAPLCAAIFILVSSAQLPPVVASHFSGSGAADGFMPRASYAVLMTVLAVGIPGMLSFFATRFMDSPHPPVNIPNRAYWLAPERREATLRYLGSRLRWLGLGVMVFLCYIHGLVLLANREQPAALPAWPFAIGMVLFLFMVFAWTLAVTRRFSKTG